MPRESTARKNAPARLRAIAGGKSNMDNDVIDTLIHERTRLAIVSALAVKASMSFREVKK